jgi:hypothetical protein
MVDLQMLSYMDLYAYTNATVTGLRQIRRPISPSRRQQPQDANNLNLQGRQPLEQPLIPMVHGAVGARVHESRVHPIP